MRAMKAAEPETQVPHVRRRVGERLQVGDEDDVEQRVVPARLEVQMHVERPCTVERDDLEKPHLQPAIRVARAFPTCDESG